MQHLLFLLLLLLWHPLLPAKPNVDSALKYVYVKEVGNNQSFTNKYLQKKLSDEGWKPGYSYCAYSVKVFNKMGGIKYPKITGGLAQSFIKKDSYSAKDVLIGKVIVENGWIVIWKHGDTYKGHTGLVQYWNKSKGKTIEGNTSNGNGSQSNGDGFYERYRTIQPRNYFRITNFTKTY